MYMPMNRMTKQKKLENKTDTLYTNDKATSPVPSLNAA